MNLHKILFSTFWSGIGFIFGKGGFLITISLVSIFLSAYDFANFNLYLMVINTFAGVIGLSMSSTANRYATTKKNVYTLLILSIFFSLSGTIIYFFLEVFYFKIFHLKINLILSCLIIVFAIFSNSLSGFFYAEGTFKKYAIVYSIQGLIMVSSCFLLGKCYGFTGVLLGILIAYFFTIIYAVFYFKSRSLEIVISNDLIVRVSKKVFFPSLFSGLLFQPAILITAFLINQYSTTTEVIAYTVANQFRMVLGVLPITLGAVLLKILVENKKDYKAHLERLNYSLSYYPIMILSIVLLFCQEFIGLIIENTDTVEFYYCLLFFVSGTVITSFKGAVSRKFVSEEKGKISILSNFSWFVIFMFMAVIFIPKYAAVGAAFSFLVAQILHLLAWSPFYVKHRFYYLDFFDCKFFISIPIYLFMILSIYFDFQYLFFSLFSLSLYLFYKEIRLLK